MADDRLRRLERTYKVEPTAETLGQLLAAKHRAGIISFSKQNIDLMGSLGIEPVVMAFLGGPPLPAEANSQIIHSYQCLSGVHHLRGCWRSFPHTHPEGTDRDHRVLQRNATQARRRIIGKRKVPAKIGWTEISEHDLHWLAKRIHKAGWRSSVIVVSALQRHLTPWHGRYGVTYAQGLEWVPHVEDLVHASAAAARSNIPSSADTMRREALDLMPGGDVHDVLFDLTFSQNHRASFAAWAVQVIAKQHRIPANLAERIADYRRRGIAVPAYWEKALQRPERTGNRNRIFGGHPITGLVQLVQHHLLPSPDVHTIMQDSIFEFYTGLKLITRG